MMKSFFKKLSLVMALAMVVATMAPAASAFAAELVIAEQTEAKADAKAEYSVAVGDKIDFKFYGAEAGWQDLYKWESLNPEIASASEEQDGVFYGLKDGEATVKLTIGEDVAEVKLVVGEGVVVPAVEVKQVSDTVATLTFEKAPASLDGMQFYFKVGETPVYYPFQLTSYKDGVATITSYVSFSDGVVYGFEVPGIEEPVEFKATIGNVATIVPSYKSEGKEWKAYATADTTISYKLLNADGVDITNVAKLSGGSIEFSFVNESETGAYWFADQNVGTVHFEEAGASATVVVKYFTGKYDETTYEPIVGAVQSVTMTAEPIPGFAIDVTAGAVATLQKNTDAIDWKKVNNVIALDDDDLASYKLVAKLASNKGDVLTTDTTYGTFSFKSTNDAKLYVSPEGYVMTNATGITQVLVYFTPNNSNNASVVAVVPVDVRAARAVASIALKDNKNAVTVSTVEPYNADELTVVLKDALGGDRSDAFEITPVTKAPKDCEVPAVWAEGMTIKVAGANNNVPANAKSYTYTFQAKCNNKVVSFQVTVRRPDSNISGYKVEFAGDSDIKTTTNANKYATFTLYWLSNGVKAGTKTMSVKPSKAAEATVGEYYFSVTKNNNAVKTTIDNDVVTIQLTNMKDTTVASGQSLAVVDKSAQGAGAYTVVVYQAVGTANASASGFRQIATSTLTVKDSQDTVTAVKKTKNTVAATTAVEAVAAGFEFTYGNGKLDLTTAVIVPYVNSVDQNKDGVLDSGSVCFVKSVDLYIPVGDGAYVKYNVAVNDYVEIQ